MSEAKAKYATPPAPKTLDQLKFEREMAVSNLVSDTEQLIRTAKVLRQQHEGLISRRYRDEVISPWSQRITATWNSLREFVLLHLAELRQIAELVDQGEAALAVRGENGTILRHARELDAEVERLRAGRPDTLQQIGLYMALPTHGESEPSNLAKQILEILLPAEARGYGEETMRQTLSYFTWDGSKVPLEILQGAGGHSGLIWRRPEIARALEAVPVEATA